MPGANYMGGSRNAAKARSKDSSGRLQRGHFSRQRLGILTNGLNPRGLDSCASRAQHFSLQHAKLDVPILARKSQNVTESYVESAAEISSINIHPSITQSNVLRVLDTSEPLSLRAQIDRILAVPNLLGLAAHPRSPSLKRNRDHDPVGSPGYAFSGTSPLRKRPRFDESEVHSYATHSVSPRLQISDSLYRTPALASLVSPPIHLSEDQIEISSQNPTTPIRFPKFDEQKPPVSLASSRRSPLKLSVPLSPPVDRFGPSISRRSSHIAVLSNDIYPKYTVPLIRQFHSVGPAADDSTSHSAASPTINQTPLPPAFSHIHHHETSIPHSSAYHDGMINTGSSNGNSMLFESLKQSSDPWALMGRNMLGLPLPSPSSRSRIRAQDTQLLQTSRNKFGVGFAKPLEYSDDKVSQALLHMAPQPAKVGGCEDENEVILNFDSSQPSPGLPATPSDTPPGSVDRRQTTYPMDRMEKTAENVLPDYDEDNNLPPSDLGLYSSSSTGADQQDSGTSNPGISTFDDIEAKDTPRFTEDKDICDAVIDALSRPVSMSEDEHMYDQDLHKNSLLLFLSPREHFTTELADIICDEPWLESDKDGAHYPFPRSGMNPRSLITDHSPQFHSATQVDSTIPNYFDRLIPTFTTASPSRTDDTKTANREDEMQTKTIAFQDPEPTDSQLLAMYINPDVAQVLHPAIPSRSFASTHAALMTPELQISKNIPDDKLQVGEDESEYSGPCLFFDQVDDEE